MAVADLSGAVTAPKLASVVARRIEDEVVAQRWPIGSILGSETDLLERYGVSRAVLREAVRIVEHTGCARMRRGPGGGLVVTEPNRSAVVTAIGMWFSYVSVTIGQMFEVRRPLLTAAVGLAAQRRTNTDVERLHRLIDDIAGQPGLGPVEFNTIEAHVVSAAGNPALGLFAEVVGDLGVTRLANGSARLDPAPTRDELVGHLDGYRRLVAAIGHRDADGAVDVIERLLNVTASRLSDATPTRRPLDLDAPSKDKLAERVVEALRDDIEAAGWAVGELLGSETEIVERYGVSRPTLREAVRIMEHHGALRTKRGPLGGLVITAPDNSAIVRSASMILEYEGVTVDRLFEARSVVEVAAVRLAAARAGGADTGALTQALEVEASDRDVAQNFMPVHHSIATVTANRPFELFVDVMGALVPGHIGPEHRDPARLAALNDEVHAAHVRIVEAIQSGDPDLAGRRMRRHLQASMDILE